MEQLNQLLAAAAVDGASDLHLKVDSRPLLRVEGRLHRSQAAPIDGPTLWRWLDGLLSPSQRGAFEARRAVDLAYHHPAGQRFRVAAFWQAGGPALVFRSIRTDIPPLEELGLPAVVAELCKERAGLVLITGATGSGKSTTLAAMIDRINHTQERTISTIEDPVEFLHKDARCHITQREIGVDAVDFKTALVETLRHDPDIILVGEMRDEETIATAMLAAETGHLVLSTLHTTDATETVHRIFMTYPEGRHSAVRIQLATTLKAVISLRLVRRRDGQGRVPAVEVMMVTDRIRDLLIAPNRLSEIRQAIAEGERRTACRPSTSPWQRCWRRAR
jgi:twitching motility protein PilT